MKECVLVAAPGGNPAPLVALIWALHQQWELRVDTVHLVLYENSRRYVESELLGGHEPLEDLRRTLGDPDLAEVVQHLVTAADEQIVEDDVDFDHQALFMESLWSVIRRTQDQSTGPVIFSLVGGRRRTLTVDIATAFQLLARPEDRLVDVRLDPKYADDPSTAFYFPGQRNPCVVHARDGSVLLASEVRVLPVDVRVPRLRHLLIQDDLETFGRALEAGEAALERGPLPKLVVDVEEKQVRVGDHIIGISYDQMVWYATLAVARRNSEDGWVAINETELLSQVESACRAIWCVDPDKLSDAYDFRPEADGERHQRLAPIRSRLRAKMEKSLKGHPHRALVVPRQQYAEGRTKSMERIEIERASIVIEPDVTFQIPCEAQ